MNQTKMHRFKLSLPVKNYEEVNDIARIFGLPIDKTIVFMLETTLPIFYKYVKIGKRYHNDYAILGKTRIIPIKLRQKFYNKIHQLHAYLNLYSNASVMRKCIKIFIWKFNRYYREKLKEGINSESLIELSDEERLILENLI